MSDLASMQLPPGQQLLLGMSPVPGQQQFVPAFSAGSLSVQQQALSAAGTLLFSQRQPLPKQLTAAIKSCTSLERLSQLFAAHQAVLNPIHIAAMITKLPKLDTSAHNPAAAAASSSDTSWNLSTGQVQQLQLRQLLQQLLLRLKAHGCDEYSPRGVANIVWALAKLQCAPDAELRGMLLDKFCSQLPTAVPQDISNVLWGVAKITKERTAAAGGTTAALQPLGFAAAASLSSPSSSTTGPSLASSTISPQSWGLIGHAGSVQSLHSSGNYDAAAVAAGAAAAVGAAAPLLGQEQVRLLLQHLCKQLHTASVQTISNSLWAVVVLQQEHQWCMCNCLGEFQNLLSAFGRQPQQALPGHIQPVIRCMAQLATTCSNHAGDSWIRWQPPLLHQLLGHLGSQKQQMEMHHVSSVLRDVAQIICLHLLRAKQLRDQQQQAFGRTASGSSAANPNSSSQPQQMNTISGAAEGEEVLARLAASGGPQDTSSTVVTLAMLQPQLKQLGLHHGVAALASMLPPAALPHLGEEATQWLLAATTTAATASQSAAAAAAAPAGVKSAAAGTAAQCLQLVIGEQGQQAGSGMAPAVLITPSALAGSSSASNSSGSNVVIGGGGDGSSSCSTSMSASTLIVSPLQQQATQAAAPGFAALESLMAPDTAKAAAAAAAVGMASPAAAGDTCGSLSSIPSLEQPQQSTLGSSQVLILTSPRSPVQQQQQLLSSAAVHGTVTAASAAAAATASPRLPQPPPLQSHQLHGLAFNPGSAASGAEPLSSTPAAAAAAGDHVVPATGEREEAAARQLTHNIANADSVYQLAEIFSAHCSVMDMIHITACITRLSKVLGTTPSVASQAAASALLPLLGSKLLQVLPKANARGIANVLWGYGRLRNLPQSDLLPELLKAFLQQLSTAACRDSAVVLWSLARLTEGQGMAAVGVMPDLLSQLGQQVLDQMSVAAAAAMDGPNAQQQQQYSAGAAPGKRSHRDGGDTSAPPSSRDISNSLMALSRLGFVPEIAAAAADKGMTAATAAVEQPVQVLPADAAAAAALTAADSDQAAATAAFEGLSLQNVASRAAAEAPEADQAQPAIKHSATAAAAAATGSSVSQAPEQQQQQPSKSLTLPLAPITTVVQFLLTRTAGAKTLDLQEAATALKQLGLQEMSTQVAAAISSTSAPGGPGQHIGSYDPPGHHHGFGLGSGAVQYEHGSGMQAFHHHLGGHSAVPGMQQQQQQHGYGGGGIRPGGPPHMYAGPGGPIGRASSGGSYGAAAAAAGGPGGYGSGAASSAAMARTHSNQHVPYQQQQQQPGAPHVRPPSVSMPSMINLSGTQLAGLLQQQRRQQPLPTSGPAYGAGWLPGKCNQEQQQQQQQRRGSGPGVSVTACVAPVVDSSAMLSPQQQQQQQQQQYRMYMPGSGAGGSPAVRRMSGSTHQDASFASDASLSGSGYMSGSAAAAAAAGLHEGYLQPGSMQQLQLQQQQQYRVYMPGSGSGAAGGSPAARRMSGSTHQDASFASDASLSGSGYMSGSAAAAAAAVAGGLHEGCLQPSSMQQQLLQQQQYQQQQRRQQQQHGHQDQWAQTGGQQPVRRLSGAQQAEVIQQQLLQQQQGYVIPGSQQQGGVQYVFVPQQYNAQQQQEPVMYLGVLPQQGMQQQQQSDLGVLMQQVLQQQPQQGLSGQQQMVMVTAPMAASMYNMSQPVGSMPGQQQQQQQQQVVASPGVSMQTQQQRQQGAGSSAWLSQRFAGAGQQQQQPQQSEQILQMLPQIQAAAAGALPAAQFAVPVGAAGSASAAAAGIGGMQYQVSSSMLGGSADYAVPVESDAVISGQLTQMVGSGSASADFAAMGLAAAQSQQQQVFGVMPATGGILQQQGVQVGAEPLGLYMQQQQQQQQQDAMQLMYGMVQAGLPVQQQQQQPGVVVMPQGAAYAFPGGQYQQ